jgi:plastocyanin
MHRFLSGLALAGLAIITVACSSGGGATAAPGSAAPSSPGASAPTGGEIVVVAKDIAFQPTSLTIKADTPTEIVLDNQEAVPHNFAVKDPAGAEVFKGEIVTSAKVTNAVPALAAGSYTFWCEVHPEMTGTLTAE